jgi:hypothetical protein
MDALDIPERLEIPDPHPYDENPVVRRRRMTVIEATAGFRLGSLSDAPSPPRLITSVRPGDGLILYERSRTNQKVYYQPT